MRITFLLKKNIFRFFSSRIKKAEEINTDVEKQHIDEQARKRISDLLSIPEIIDYDQPNVFKGNLILCPTPIGNLKDISFRAYEAITTADLIACEDTRTTGKLLHLLKERKFNERLDEILGEKHTFDPKNIGKNEDFETDENVFHEYKRKSTKEEQIHPNSQSIRRLKDKLKDFHQKTELNEIKKTASKILTSNDSLGFLTKYGKEDIIEENINTNNNNYALPFISEEEKKNQKPISENDDEYFYDSHSKSRRLNKQTHEKTSFDDEFINFIKSKIFESKLKRGRGLLLSCHRFNEEQRIEDLLKLMKAGLKIVLVPDAGSPCISDPGQILINEAIKNKIAIESLPGPNSVTLALTSSGFPGNYFSFYSFWPKNEGERNFLIEQIKSNRVTNIFFENKHRIMNTLLILEKSLGKRQMISISIEMTKLHERMLRGTIESVYDKLNKNPDYTMPSLKGELTIVLAPFTKEYNLDLVDLNAIDKKNKHQNSQKELYVNVDKTISVLSQKIDLSTKDLVDLMSKFVPMSRNHLYDRIVQVKKSQKVEPENNFEDLII